MSLFSIVFVFYLEGKRYNHYIRFFINIYMWGITMYLMRLADYLQGRKDKKTCRLCNYIAKNENALNNHMQKEHGL